MTWRFTKPLLRKHAPHCGQRGHDVGRRARSANTDSTRCMARTRATCHAARISAVSERASSIARSRRCTDGSSSRMLSVRHSIGKWPPLESLAEDAKSVPRFRCYASPPPTEICAPSVFYQFLLVSFGRLGDKKRWWVYPEAGFFSKDIVLDRVEFLLNRSY